MILNTAKSRTDMQPVMAELGRVLRSLGYTADDLPPLQTQAYYGDRNRMYVANTKGLREGDIQKCHELGKAEFARLKQEHPGAKGVVRTTMMDMTILPSHPVLGSGVKEKHLQGPYGQAMHAVLTIGIVTKEGEFIPAYVQESTGAANHPTGERAENPSFSFNGDHKSTVTNPYFVRNASKDGEIYVGDLTGYSKEFQGQNTNLTYSYEGSEPQHPEGMISTPKFFIDKLLSDEDSERAFGEFLLTRMGGQIIHSDEKIPNTNKEYAKEFPDVHEIISAGSVGPHAQTGAGSMCAKFIHDQLYGESGLAFEGGEWPFMYDPMTFTNTHDVFMSHFLYATNRDIKNIIWRSGEGEVIPPEKFIETFGEEVIGYYRKTALNEIARRQESGELPDGYTVPETIMINGSGVTIPVNLREKTTFASSTETIAPFVMSGAGGVGRALDKRYGSDQQTKDHGGYIDLRRPPIPQEVNAINAFILQHQKRYEIPQDLIDGILAKVPRPSPQSNEPEPEL